MLSKNIIPFFYNYTLKDFLFEFFTFEKKKSNGNL